MNAAADSRSAQNSASAHRQAAGKEKERERERERERETEREAVRVPQSFKVEAGVWDPASQAEIIQKQNPASQILRRAARPHSSILGRD